MYNIQEDKMNDTRKNIRVPLTASARLIYNGPEGVKSIDSTVGSISMMGIGVYADCMPGKSTPLLVEISFFSSDGQLKTAEMEGQVINANEVSALCYICIVFKEEINAQKQPSLHEHLLKLMKR